MTTPLIEAIARAIFESQWVGEYPTSGIEHAMAIQNAQAALTAITEAGYEIAPKGAMAALDASRVAIDDWLNTYAPDECSESRVEEARDRIFQNGGTLAYIAQIQEHNRAISAAQGDGA